MRHSQGIDSNMYREGVGVDEQGTCAKADDEGVAIQWVSPAAVQLAGRHERQCRVGHGEPALLELEGRVGEPRL